VSVYSNVCSCVFIQGGLIFGAFYLWYLTKSVNWSKQVCFNHIPGGKYIPGFVVC